MSSCHVILALNCLLTLVEGGRILIIQPTPSYSHQQPALVLAEELIRKGHNVTLISTNSIPGLKNKYSFIDLSFAYKYYSPSSATDIKVNFQKTDDKWEAFQRFPTMLKVLEEQILSDPFQTFQRHVESNNVSFDLAIIESWYTPYFIPIIEAISGQTPVIAFLTLPSNFAIESAMGSLVHYSFVPELLDGCGDRMSFWQKLENWYFSYVYRSRVEKKSMKMTQDFLRKHYGHEIEALAQQALRKISLLMFSSNFLYYYPRQLSPNIIELGPLHIKTPQALPSEIQNWLDNAENGAIYLSLGSNMRSKSLPKEILSNFLRVFRMLPTGYRVLWKWESKEKIPGQSENILTYDWLPQQSVLAHPKTKVFITQGGLQSFQETVHYGVPTIVVPFFGDQRSNAKKMAETGIGYLLQPIELYSYEKIKAAVERVLFNDSYTHNMKKYSTLSHDFTNHSIDKATFWIEHILRHGSAMHLTPSTIDVTYFEFLCLDILSVVVSMGTLCLYSMYKIMQFLLATKTKDTKIKNS